MDAQETSGIIGLNWLLKHQIQDRQDTITVSFKNVNGAAYQKIKQNKNLKIIQSSFRTFAEIEADYSILTINFIPKKVLKKFFPPKGTIHVETVDGKPICAVVKRNHFDSDGIKAIKENKIDEGMTLLEKAYAFDPDNFGIWFWMGYGYYQQQQYQKSIDFFTKSNGLWPINGQVLQGEMYTGASLLQLNQVDQAITKLSGIAHTAKDNFSITFITANLGVAYYQKGDFRKAIPLLEKAVPFYPNLQAQLQQAYRMVK
jgi:tetratricopeptide (TPR) repeat protein